MEIFDLFHQTTDIATDIAWVLPDSILHTMEIFDSILHTMEIFDLFCLPMRCLPMFQWGASDA